MDELKWKFENGNQTEKIGILHYYDCGAYVGFLYEDEWKCYHILSRNTSEDGNIIETVEIMPEDWVPKHVYSIEELEVYEKTNSVLKIKDWLIELPQLQEQEHYPQLQLQSPSQQRGQGRDRAQGRDREQGKHRHPHIYNPPSSQQERPQQRQQHREQDQPSQQLYHQQHTSYSQQKNSSQHQRQKSHPQRREMKQQLSQNRSNTAEAVSPLSSSDSTYHERHQSQHRLLRGQQKSQLREVVHSGPQWTSLQSLLVSPALALPPATSPKPALKPLLPNPSSEYPLTPVVHLHGQQALHRQKLRHSQHPVGFSKQRPKHHVSPQSDLQYSPSM